MADREKKGKMEIQKFEYLKNEKSFLDEIKKIFHSFWRAIIWWKIKIWYRSLTVILTVLLFWIYLFLLMLVFVLQWLSLYWEILTEWLSQFPLNFCQTPREMPCFIALLMTILVLIGTVFVIIWEMFHGTISLNLVLLLLLVNFVSGFRFELMYISLIINIRSSLTYLHGFQLLVLLP